MGKQTEGEALRLRYRVGGGLVGSEEGSFDRRRVILIGRGFLRSEEGFMHRRRVLTKFQVNLVIPKNNTYGYISTKRQGYVFMGVF